MTFRGDHPDELISASLTGDLTDAERAELDAHLAHCERCRATLAAFKSERRILSGLPVADPPRDLSARVRGGIEAGRYGGPWWRRPGSQVPLLASAAVFAAAILSVVYFGHLLPAPVGQASGSPVATAPSASVVASTAPSVRPSGTPDNPRFLILGPGGIGYLAVDGAPFAELHLSFVDVVTQTSIDAGTVSGPPIAASLSPDGNWLAYITEMGETGANEVWALNLADRQVVLLGCSLAEPFADRLTWSPRGDLLAFTISAIRLGSTNGCPTPTDPDGTTRVWLFRTDKRAAAPLMEAGTDSYAASFERIAIPDAPNRLWISRAGTNPFSELVSVIGGETLLHVDGMFLPLVAPDGNRVLFWRGTMSQQSDGSGWTFSRGGMPLVSGDRNAIVDASVWDGEQLITDLTVVGGEAFAQGKFVWGPDSDLVAFWNGAWTGAPQSADGTYPALQDVLAGRISTGLLNSVSRVPLALENGDSIVDVALRPDGGVVATVRLPSAGIGDPPSAGLAIASSDSVGVAVVPPQWAGPAIYGP